MTRAGAGSVTPMKQRPDNYGDNDFRGRGRIMCKVCGEPLRDHDRIGPCPKAGVGTLVGDKRPSQRPIDKTLGEPQKGA